MDKKTILTIFILAFFLISLSPTLVSAEKLFDTSSETIVYKQYDTATFKDPCRYNGAPCGGTATCKATILYPNGSFMIDNEALNNTGNDMPSIPLPDTSVLGEFPSSMSCTQNGISSGSDFSFYITPTGRITNLTVPIFLILISLMLFIVGLATNYIPVGFLSGILFMITGVYMMIYGLGNVADDYTRYIAYIVLAWGSITAILAGYEWLDQ